MSERPFATGGCICGAVTFTARKPPMRMAQCCCRDCQRSSGTGHMSLAFFDEQGVEIRGDATGYAATADSGNINTRYFCPTCGSRVFSRNSARPGVVAIAVGSAEDSAWFEPGAVVYARSRPAWDTVKDTIPSFDTMPPPPK
ncbi:MAG: GFA family protein [Proteobacteria bacterium]|nr:MAG: GFA family protein [Pseudomonadota bacterium]